MLFDIFEMIQEIMFLVIWKYNTDPGPSFLFFSLSLVESAGHTAKS